MNDEIFHYTLSSRPGGVRHLPWIKEMGEMTTLCNKKVGLAWVTNIDRTLDCLSCRNIHERDRENRNVYNGSERGTIMERSIT